MRSFDREHALKLVEAGVDVQIRETFESALKFGEIALRELGVPEDEAAETAEDIRRRDAERFALETTGGLLAGRDLLHGNVPTPVPFTTPRRPRAAGAASLRTVWKRAADASQAGGCSGRNDANCVALGQRRFLSACHCGLFPLPYR